MNTAAGLRFLRALTRMGENTPAYLESRSRTTDRPATLTHSQPPASNRPVAPSVRLG